MILIVAKDFIRCGQEFELVTFIFGSHDFHLSSRHLLAGSAVYAVHLLASQAKQGAGTVNGRVAGTDHSGPFTHWFVFMRGTGHSG